MTNITRSVRRMTIALAVSVSLMVSACQPERGETQAGAEARTDMPGMPGMEPATGNADDATMARMRAHLRAMDGAGGDSLAAMVPTHRPMVANMIAQMNREMRDMQMPTDAAWDATVDSLRQDLIRLPELPAAELPAFMPAHRERVMRLIGMHRSMQDTMKR